MVQVQDPDLTGITHLLVDEIHERGMNEDFLLIILRDILPRRPNLRVVLMSATINAELFSSYFGNAPTIHIPVCTVILRVQLSARFIVLCAVSYGFNFLYFSVQGLTFPVKELYLEDVLEKTRYTVQPESDKFPRNSRRGRRQEEPKKDPLTELFEVCSILTYFITS